MKNYYDILGLKQDCSQDEVKKAYRKLSLKFHPDKNEGDEYFSEMFKQVNEANEILSNPVKRSEYDRKTNSENKSPNQSYRPNTTNNQAYNSTAQNRQNLRQKLEVYLSKTDEEYKAKKAFESAQYIPKPTYLTTTKVLGSLALVLIVFAVYKNTASQPIEIPSNTETKPKVEREYKYNKPKKVKKEQAEEYQATDEKQNVEVVEPTIQETETTRQDYNNQVEQNQQTVIDTVQNPADEEPKKKKKRWRLFGKNKKDDE